MFKDFHTVGEQVSEVYNFPFFESLYAQYTLTLLFSTNDTTALDQISKYYISN